MSLFASQRQLGWIGALVGLAGIVFSVGVMRALINNPHSQVNPTDKTAITKNNYDYNITSAPAQIDQPIEQLQESVHQWPSSRKDQMHQMSDRLTQVVNKLNMVNGTHVIAMLGQTGRGAVANGDGTITVDASALWRLSEDGLAALIAHEIANEVIRQRDGPRRFSRDADSKETGAAERMRTNEIAADEFAGQIIAKTKFKSSGFKEMVHYTGSAESSQAQQYYPTDQRLRTFEHSFQSARQLITKATGPATRPVITR